jgi:tetratricopeptide (TPR) repeat protein
MDGRWKQFFAGGVVAAAVGCNTAPKQLNPDGQVVQQAKPSQIAKAPPPPPSIPRTSLKPETYVMMGALKDQAADEVDRPEPERQAFRLQARESYEKAISVDPKFVKAYTAIAKSYSATDENDKAKAMFTKALVLAPNDAGVWYEYGAAQARAKDFPGAIQSLNRALDLAPDNKNVQKLIGFTLARGGRYEDALNALVKCMPEPEARYNLARMMQHNNQGDASQVQLRLAAQMEPAFEPARTAVASMAPPADSGIRQASYQAPAQPASPPASLPPVMLGGGS